MKAEYLKVEKPFSQTINVRKDIKKYFYDKWHYHSLLELVYIIRGEGFRFVGDNISRFASGDLVLLGAKLPHVWKSDDSYFNEGYKKQVSAIVLHFPFSYLGKSMWDIPEFLEIKNLFERAGQGISFNIEQKHPIKKILLKMQSQTAFEHILSLTKLLNMLSGIKEIDLLSKRNFTESYKENSSQRIDKIYDFVIKNFEHNIALKDAAYTIHMSRSSFCRFFKQKTGKSFTEFTNEVRVRYACRLLTEEEFSISEVCFKSGFNSLSYFNRKFKSITGMKPGMFVERKKKFTTIR